jgi:hypothetical protein
LAAHVEDRGGPVGDGIADAEQDAVLDEEA